MRNEKQPFIKELKSCLLNRTYFLYGLFVAIYFLSVKHNQLSEKQTVYKYGYFVIQDKKDFNSGVLTFDLLSQTHKKNAAPLTELALLYYKAGEFEWAERYFLRARAIDEDNEILGFYLTEVYFKNNKLQKAYRLASDLIKTATQPELLAETARMFSQSPYKELAINLFMRSVAIDDDQKEVYVDLGNLYSNMTLYDLAMSTWKVGKNKFPEDKTFEQLIQAAERLKEKKPF